MLSRWEAFGLVAVEAMKYGKAVIASDRGALPELIKNGENGFAFSMETRDSLKNVLDLLDKNQLRQMGYKAENFFQIIFRRKKCSPEL